MAIFRYSKDVPLVNAKFEIKTAWRKSKYSIQGIDQKLFRIIQVSFYRREKEDREWALIGLDSLFILKFTFFQLYFFLKQCLEKSMMVTYKNLKIDSFSWTSEIVDVSTKIHVPGSLESPSHGQTHGQFYLSRCSLLPTVVHLTLLGAGKGLHWWKWEKWNLNTSLALGNKTAYSD